MSGSLNRDRCGDAAVDESVAAAGASHSPVPERLLSAVARASGISWSATHEFREALCEWVRALREEGLDVVQTIIAVKAAVARVSPSLLEQSVKWSIEQYYLSAPRAADAGSGKSSSGDCTSPVK